MRRRERFLTALGLREADRVPMFDFLFQQPLYEHLIGHRPEAYNGADAVRCALALDHDGIPVDNILAMFTSGRRYGGTFYATSENNQRHGRSA